MGGLRGMGWGVGGVEGIVVFGVVGVGGVRDVGVGGKGGLRVLAGGGGVCVSWGWGVWRGGREWSG